jgi:hypothetical protein
MVYKTFRKCLETAVCESKLSCSCHFDESFDIPNLCLRHRRGQDKFREEKSTLHRVEDFSLPLEMTGYRSK